MTKRLDDIAARVEAATPGPWEVRSSSVAVVGDDKGPYICTTPSRNSMALWASWVRGDAPFVAAARTDVPYLLAIARAAERLAASGFRNHVCGGAWEPLQHGETPEGRGRCCPFCADAWSLRAALESKEDVR